MDIKETKEVFEWAKLVSQKLVQEKNDDGKLDTGEIIKVIVSTMPQAIKAIAGSGLISQEWADRDDAEKEELLNDAMVIIQNLSSLFFPAG